MRKLLVLSLIAVMAMSFFAASAQIEADPSGQTVVFWHQWNGDPQLSTINTIIENFNATNEWGITVEGLNQGDYDAIREAMNAGIISGELPNLVSGFANDAISYYVDEGVIDLDPYFNDPTYGYTAEEAAKLNQSILNLYVFDNMDGVRLGIPSQVSANVLVVNLSMVQALGFDGPPETYDDFLAIACAAAGTEGNLGYPIKGGASDVESHLSGLGGSIFQDGRYVFTSPAFIQVLEVFKKVYDDGCAYIPDSQFGNTADFALGLNPMAETSTAGIPFILGDMAEAGYETEWVVTTTPWTEGNRSVQLFAPGIFITPSTPEQELASWLFLKYFTNTENQILWTTSTSYFPLNTEAAANLGDFTVQNPFFAQALALVNDPNIHIYQSPQQLSYGAIRGLIAEAVADVTTNGRDVNEVAQELEDEANAIHEDLSQ
jgi:multiple sugar transport system substrate-binding protein/sn-glycerol 3-phosphate transport system substrate-binding protein